MVRYILKRLIIMIPIIVGITLIVFAILNYTPGDAATLILGFDATEASLDALRAKLKLDDPFMVRYVRYLVGLLKGDLGISWRHNTPVAAELMNRIPNTLGLAAYAVTVMLILGIPMGIISAVRQYSLLDHTTLFIALLMTSIPTFWLALMMMLKFSLELGILPATMPTSAAITWKHWVLPTFMCSANLTASTVRTTRSNMLEVIRSDYIRTAKSKGAGQFRVIMYHALRNALMPVVTIVGINFNVLMGGAVITEQVFNISGVGNLLISSVRTKDAPMAMGCIIFIATVIGIVNLLVDLLYVFINPRLKSMYVRNNAAKEES
ncbi:ABC transporter permease [Sedimentibacter hydroxybenzoicus DSM 7310]|uniref:ABC transporter permease n=1 Tax=Sedimentibacter hydroxybenzoicus DSM 7310 TaxID=1123245 RepID=A0A974BGL2_SEDHY|nr:ABC transporter permease [Sedimentibacter hydroxybenzoicus]NYB72717.1 ABC transporter permease [Sedimentibacter hydroxybenzoicus DSM 7310]